MEAAGRFKDQRVFSWDGHLGPLVSTGGGNWEILKLAGCRQFDAVRLRTRNMLYLHLAQRCRSVLEAAGRFKDQLVFSWDDHPLRPPVSTDGRNRGILKPAGCRQFRTGRLRSENAAYTYFEQRYNGVLEAAGRFKDQRVFSWDGHPLRPPVSTGRCKNGRKFTCPKTT